MSDDEPFPDIPDFLRLTAEERAAGWRLFPPTTSARASSGRVISDTERLYRASIERDKAKKRAEDEARFREMREQAAVDKAERDLVATSVKKRRH
jgi:hypothetical protein